MPHADPPILVAACGNMLAGDDAFGPLVAQFMRRMALPGIEVLDLGMQPAGLVCELAERAAVIVVDAAAPDAEFPPARLIDLDFFDPRRPPLAHDVRLSSHSLSIADELLLAEKLQMLPPRVRLIAAPLESTDWGSAMSESVKALVEPAAQRAAEWARLWLAESAQPASTR